MHEAEQSVAEEKQDSGKAAQGVSAKVEPCPFCGGEPIVLAWYPGTRVGCRNGGCKVRPYVIEPTKRKALQAWNGRR